MCKAIHTPRLIPYPRASDLATATDGSAVIGDVIIIECKVELDKDYGYGYVYPIILEDASINKE